MAKEQETKDIVTQEHDLGEVKIASDVVITVEKSSVFATAANAANANAMK